ncbi:uncharacterized protein LOC108739738 isoform X1 [Agrilus planipennis]|uniref:Uncharacterized protein LOC108739738 isoform X1 n=1 Tax=Agrilus planipennis TaxID=224129 RepID=A0A1W4WZH5_AGRPL|nr:uncharacterized protein LOC108739738 isoform X1 [Agrilus planipennis]
MHSEESDSSLPFFPDFDTEYHKHILRVTWFETDFSQSRYSFKSQPGGSNACTIIAILMAWKCHFKDINVKGPDKELNIRLIYALAHSMLEGNDIHNELKKRGSLYDINLTVPEAIKFSGLAKYGLTEWKSLLFMEPLCDTLHHNIKNTWSQWVNNPLSKSHPDMYIVLISDSRSVLFIIQYAFNTVAVVDSHQHASAGALIAITYRQRLQLLCQWFSEMSEKLYNSHPEVYELSFLYFKNGTDSDFSLSHSISESVNSNVTPSFNENQSFTTQSRSIDENSSFEESDGSNIVRSIKSE